MTSVRSYLEVTKPRIVLLLVFTSVAAMIAASRLTSTNLTIGLWLPAVVTITLGCAGCNAVTCYIDRDIDAVMTRTRNRPLPSFRINPPQKALIFGLALVGLSLALALMRNLLSFVSIAFGALDNIVIYSLLLKRRSPANILLGGISGGLPSIFGWAYVANSVSLTAALMAILVVLWIPNHIWSLAVKFKEDYEKASVPMLPVVTEEEKALRYIVATSLLLVVFSLWLFFSGAFGLAYLLVASVLGGLMCALNIWLFLTPTTRTAWTVFKFSSPYLALIFLAMIIDSLPI
jgi:protoheme IX farnesyltransferase